MARIVADERSPSAKSISDYGRETLVEMLRLMTLVRAFDSTLRTLSNQLLIGGSSHPCIGQEAVAVGACLALQPRDLVTSTHRGHGHAIAKGADVRAMMAELLGRSQGCCHGKGGSMHIADFSVGMLGANGIVGGGVGIGTGAALAAAIRNSHQVVLCMFGDGAVNQGILYECGNMAALWKLPLVLLCENNQFSMSTRPADVTSTVDLPGRVAGWGIPGTQVDGTDVVAVFDAVSGAVDRARQGLGPSFLEAKCYRFEGHFLGDGLKYRSAEELAEWRKKDPIGQFGKRLVNAGVLTSADVSSIAEECDARVREAIEFAKNSPLPEPADVWSDVLA